MKRSALRAILILLVSIVANLATGAQATEGKRVLLIAREKSEDMGFMLKNEVLPMVAQLIAAGYEVVVADESGSSISGGDQQLNIDEKLSEARVTGFAGLLVPCMAASGGKKPMDSADLIVQFIAAMAGS